MKVDFVYSEIYMHSMQLEKNGDTGLLHEYTHQFTDSLLGSNINMDEGSHDLSENVWENYCNADNVVLGNISRILNFYED